MSSADQEEDPTVRRSRRAIAAGLLISLAGSIWLLIAYWGHHGTQAEGLGLGIAVGGLALAAGVWGRRAVPERVAVEHRPPMPSSTHEREEVAESARLDDVGVGRRRTFLALVGASLTALLAALVSPLRSFGPSPFPERERTAWTRGLRLVDADGRPIRADDLDIDTIETVFPEGDLSRADSQVVLIRLREETLELPPERRAWVAEGHVAYSKVCTHAGCPVGLYDSETQELLCPCHQSVFKAAQGARPSFGPAARALPQLPLGVDEEGYLIAENGFSEPVGPSYWSRP